MEIAQIDDEVVKISKKPFKSGEKVGIVTALCSNLQDPKKRLAYVMDDGSIVNADKCETSKRIGEAV